MVTSLPLGYEHYVQVGGHNLDSSNYGMPPRNQLGRGLLSSFQVCPNQRPPEPLSQANSMVRPGRTEGWHAYTMD